MRFAHGAKYLKLAQCHAHQRFSHHVLRKIIEAQPRCTVAGSADRSARLMLLRVYL